MLLHDAPMVRRSLYFSSFHLYSLTRSQRLIYLAQVITTTKTVMTCRPAAKKWTRSLRRSHQTWLAMSAPQHLALAVLWLLLQRLFRLQPQVSTWAEAVTLASDLAILRLLQPLAPVSLPQRLAATMQRGRSTCIASQ